MSMFSSSRILPVAFICSWVVMHTYPNITNVFHIPLGMQPPNSAKADSLQSHESDQSGSEDQEDSETTVPLSVSSSESNACHYNPRDIAHPASLVIPTSSITESIESPPDLKPPACPASTGVRKPLLTPSTSMNSLYTTDMKEPSLFSPSQSKASDGSSTLVSWRSSSVKRPTVAFAKKVEMNTKKPLAAPKKKVPWHSPGHCQIPDIFEKERKRPQEKNACKARGPAPEMRNKEVKHTSKEPWRSVGRLPDIIPLSPLPSRQAARRTRAM